MTSVSSGNYSTVDPYVGRSAPWSQEAEQAVLGAMLLDQDAALRAAELVDDSMFYREPHRRLFRATPALTEQRTVIDHITLRDTCWASAADIAATRAGAADPGARPPERPRWPSCSTGARVNEERLAQELAFLADKLDITEELVRFQGSHGRSAPALHSRRQAGRQAARLSGPGAGSRGEYHGRQGGRRRDRAAGDRHEGRAREVPGTAREPRVKRLLLVLSAPSGGGKTTIARKLLQARNDLGYSVSATTRADAQRGAGRSGLLLPEAVRSSSAAGTRMSSSSGPSTEAQLYGTLKREIERILSEGRHAVLDVDIEGARQIRKNLSNSLQVFVLPPSAEVLIERLKGRNTENRELLRKRLTRASEELDCRRRVRLRNRERRPGHSGRSRYRPSWTERRTTAWYAVSKPACPRRSSGCGEMW